MGAVLRPNAGTSTYPYRKTRLVFYLSLTKTAVRLKIVDVRAAPGQTTGNARRTAPREPGERRRVRRRTVIAYHERTKHHYGRFAASIGYMDWATQLNPFRRYHGAALVRLSLPQEGRALPYWQLYVTTPVDPAPLSIDSISLFFRYALSLTAWKRVHNTT